MNNKEVYESFTTENIGESEKERVLKIIKERDAEKAKKAAASKKVPFKLKKPTATEPLPAPSAPLNSQRRNHQQEAIASKEEITKEEIASQAEIS